MIRAHSSFVWNASGMGFYESSVTFWPCAPTHIQSCKTFQDSIEFEDMQQFAPNSACIGACAQAAKARQPRSWL